MIDPASVNDSSVVIHSNQVLMWLAALSLTGCLSFMGWIIRSNLRGLKDEVASLKKEVVSRVDELETAQGTCQLNLATVLAAKADRKELDPIYSRLNALDKETATARAYVQGVHDSLMNGRREAQC